MLKGLLSVIGRIVKGVERRKYTPHTKGDYFRRLGASVGEGCFIVPWSLGVEPYLVRIGNHVAIAQGAMFITHDGGTWVFRHEIPDLQVFGPIIVEDNCVIGANAVLLPGVRIGKNSIVGANSVVVTDVPENTIVMGVPARPFGAVAKYKEKCVERWAVQRPTNCRVDEGETWWSTKHFAENRVKLRSHLLGLFEADLKR